WGDIFCVDPAPQLTAQCGSGLTPRAVLRNSAKLSPVAAKSIAYAETDTIAQTGTGFILYLNGEFFLMQMAALPASGDSWRARLYGEHHRNGRDGGFRVRVRPSHTSGSGPRDAVHVHRVDLQSRDNDRRAAR